ncbi:MAG TPA: transcriptional regulator GcvA [Steroidobacter sp.]|uniref:transcriptional regulator GcvA n=1 Tax=Steroidobacter sp. TaxID=1978227 RepID=UPI002ED8EF54
MSAETKLPLNALRAFEAVAAHLSFTGAAQSLNVTTAAVSSHIKALEEFLETPLFVRHSRSVRLTPQGARLLPGVQRGMSELTRAVDQLRLDRSSGLLNISLLGSFLQKWLLPRLGDFYQKHPEVDLRFSASRELVDFMQTDFHAAVRYGSGSWPQIQAEKMLDDWVFPVASPTLFAKLGPISTLADLNKYPLLHSASEPWIDWLRRVGGDTTRVERGPILDDSASVLAAAEQGHGLALARWSLVAGDLASGRLVRPSSQSVRQHNSYYFVAPAHNFEVPKVIRFRNWLREVCNEFPPPEGERLEPQ